MLALSLLHARILVVLKAAPTYLVAAATILGVFADEIAAQFPGAGDPIAHVLVPVLAGLAAAVSIIRRVTPVLTGDRGLL